MFGTQNKSEYMTNFPGGEKRNNTKLKRKYLHPIYGAKTKQEIENSRYSIVI